MDSTMETWSYESLCFYVDKDGIESMTYSNPYTIGNIKTENLNLLSFSEIMKIYEVMLPKKSQTGIKIPVCASVDGSYILA